MVPLKISIASGELISTVYSASYYFLSLTFFRSILPTTVFLVTVQVFLAFRNSSTFISDDRKRRNRITSKKIKRGKKRETENKEHIIN